jgi:salicylate hydroxylase
MLDGDWSSDVCSSDLRIVLSGREMGRLYHAAGVERLVRNSLWQGRSQERFYDAMEWLYGWNVNNCLA